MMRITKLHSGNQEIIYLKQNMDELMKGVIISFHDKEAILQEQCESLSQKLIELYGLMGKTLQILANVSLFRSTRFVENRSVARTNITITISQSECTYYHVSSDKDLERN
jgi:hypothetical protein